jgi:PEP-CTERM motif
MKIFVACSLALLAGVAAHAQGLIWSADRWAEMSSTPGESWQIAFDHTSDQFFPTRPNQNFATRIFPLTIGTNDTGHTFFANGLSDPGFAGFIAGLTDGTNGYLRFQVVSAGVVYPPSEQDFLGRSSLSPDLAGYYITQIGFRVNNFYDWYYPAEERNFRTLNYSLDFYGAPVPEPGTWAMLGLGGAAALLLRRKQQRRLTASAPGLLRRPRCRWRDFAGRRRARSRWRRC